MPANSAENGSPTARKVSEFCMKHWKAISVALVVILLIPRRWVFSTWFLEQVRMMRCLLVSPVSAEQFQDVNFWGGQIISLILVTASTWIMLNSRHLWETYVLNALFSLPWQKALFKHLLLGSLQDAAFMFLSRQLTMLFIGFFLPDYNPDPTDVDTLGWWRWVMDGKVCTALYILLAMLWYGNKIGLFRASLERAELVLRVAFAAHWFGVGILRVYPVLNHSGMSLPTALRLMVGWYPITTLLLGALAVWPAMLLGRHIKAQVSMNIFKIFQLYLMHVITVMWAHQAGHAMGQALLEHGEFTTPLNSFVSMLSRVTIVTVLVAVMAFYGHAVQVLYLSSPLFMCEWDRPTIKDVKVTDETRIVAKLRAGYDQYFNEKAQAAAHDPMGLDVVGIIRHVMGLSIAVRQLWRGQGALRATMMLECPVTNFSDRAFKLNTLRLVVQTQHGSTNRAATSEASHDLITIAVHGIKVKPGQSTITVKCHCLLEMGRLLKLARVSIGGDPLERLDVTLYSASELSPQLQFTIPLVSFIKGKWYGVFPRTKFVPEPNTKTKRKLLNLLTAVKRRQQQILSNRMQRAPEALQTDLTKLNQVLERLALVDLSRPETKQDEVMDDLLEAGYRIVCVYDKESRLAQRKAKLRSNYVTQKAVALARHSSSQQPQAAGEAASGADADSDDDKGAQSSDEEGEGGGEEGAGGGEERAAGGGVVTGVEVAAAGIERALRSELPDIGSPVFMATMMKATSVLLNLGYEFSMTNLQSNSDPTHQLVLVCSLTIVLGLVDRKLANAFANPEEERDTVVDAARRLGLGGEVSPAADDGDEDDADGGDGDADGQEDSDGLPGGAVRAVVPPQPEEQVQSSDDENPAAVEGAGAGPSSSPEPETQPQPQPVADVGVAGVQPEYPGDGRRQGRARAQSGNCTPQIDYPARPRARLYPDVGTPQAQVQGQGSSEAVREGAGQGEGAAEASFQTPEPTRPRDNSTPCSAVAQSAVAATQPANTPQPSAPAATLAGLGRRVAASGPHESDYEHANAAEWDKSKRSSDDSEPPESSELPPSVAATANPPCEVAAMPESKSDDPPPPLE